MTLHPVDNPWDQLEALLTRQREALRQGNWRQFEALLDRGRPLVQQLSQAQVPAPQMDRLTRLGRQIELGLKAHHHQMADQIRRLCGGRRLVQAYKPSPL